MMEKMSSVIRSKRLVIGFPCWLGPITALFSDIAARITGGLIAGPVTKDQLKALRVDNVVSDAARGFADLGITPTAMEAVLGEYLWRYRPSGQYTEMKDAARKMES